MSLLSKGIQTLRTEGFRIFLKKSAKYFTNKIDPRPSVTDDATFILYWYLKYVYNIIFSFRNGPGVDVMDRNWDTLILLDACRFDDFKAINDIQGNLTAKISKGVDSGEFIKKNFVGDEFSETVYVTANPHVRIIPEDTFHDIIIEPMSNWDSELQCVPPQEVTSSAIEAHKKYPNKRIIVHYMQPHDPPLGSKADELRDKNGIGGVTPDKKNSDGERIMQLVADGEISEKDAHSAYRETLEIVLGEVQTLLEHINGKVVISADHGEMFGESPYPFLGNLYEHYENPKTTELCKVPWLVVESGSTRREVIPESSTGSINSVNNDEIEDQLIALGYR